MDKAAHKSQVCPIFPLLDLMGHIFCCTMRLAEGLWYIHNNLELFTAHTAGKVSKQGRVYADGDILYAQISGGGEAYAEQQVKIDGLTLSPLVKYYKLPKEVIETTRQKILF